MKTKREQNIKKSGDYSAQRGNALIYVLIAIALFAALGFTLSRQASNSGEDMDDAKAQILATQLIAYSAQVKSVIDQMMFTGTDIDELDFTLPSEAGFSTAPYIHKIYHPQGGGLTPATLPENVINELSSTPPADWYLGNFNNVEWTDSGGTDVILTAYQIKKTVCEKINEDITGSNSIPAFAGSGDMDDYLLDTATNTEFSIAICGVCEGYSSLCVSNGAGTAYSFYTVIADR